MSDEFKKILKHLVILVKSYTPPIDSTDKWKFEIKKELEFCGYTIN